MGRNTSETIRARYRGTEHGQNNKSEGYRGFTDLRDRSETTRDDKTIR